MVPVGVTLRLQAELPGYGTQVCGQELEVTVAYFYHFDELSDGLLSLLFSHLLCTTL